VLQIFLLEDVVFGDVVFDDVFELVVLGIGFELVVEMTFEVNDFDVDFALVDFDVVFELLDFDMVLLALEDEAFFEEVGVFDDEIAFDELTLEGDEAGFDELALEDDETALEEDVVERRLWVEVDDLCTVIFDDEVVFEEDDALVELVLVAREDELFLSADGDERKLLDLEVGVELDAREGCKLELVDDEGWLELEAAVEEDKLELLLLFDDDVELLLEEAELPIDVESVVGEEIREVGQRDGG
jgi:hypothetical protein